MNKHFITEIEIKNFKCFKDFTAEGFKRVNLIGGKNNVGKTALMESLYINAHSCDINSLTKAITDIKSFRETLNLSSHLEKILKNMDISKLVDLAGMFNLEQLYFQSTQEYNSKSNIRAVKFQQINESRGLKYFFSIDEKQSLINHKDFNFSPKRLHNVIFINSFGFTNEEIIDSFITIQMQDKEDYLNKILSNFDKTIEGFKVIDQKPKVKYQGSYRDITEFGDGLKQLISIICAVFSAHDGYLFIDEIDNGVFYTKLDILWEVIFKISKELNIQVFATTHSKDCIESYCKTAIKLHDEEMSYTKLTLLKSGKIYAGIYDYGMLENSIEEQGNEVRGW